MTVRFRGKITIKDSEKLIEKRKNKGFKLDSIGFRFELFRVYLGLTAQTFSELISISQGSYSDLQSDKSKPSCQTIINMFDLDEARIDVEWLLTGYDTN